jgi:hypothetical protein
MCDLKSYELLAGHVLLCSRHSCASVYHMHRVFSSAAAQSTMECISLISGMTKGHECLLAVELTAKAITVHNQTQKVDSASLLMKDPTASSIGVSTTMHACARGRGCASTLTSK